MTLVRQSYCPNCDEPLVRPPDEREKLVALWNLLTDGTDPAGLVEDAITYLREPVAETDALVEALERLLEAEPPTDLSRGQDWWEARAHAASHLGRGRRSTTAKARCTSSRSDLARRSSQRRWSSDGFPEQPIEGGPMTDGPGGLGDVVFAPNIEIVPVPEENYEGRQWGYMIHVNGVPALHVTTGGTGDCWNIAEAATHDSQTGEVVEGMEEGASLHICDLDEFIAILTALRDSDAHAEHVKRWSS